MFIFQQVLVDGVQTAGKMYNLAGVMIKRTGEDIWNFPYSIIRRMGQGIQSMRAQFLNSFGSSNRFGGTDPLYRPDVRPAPYTTRRKERVPNSILDKLQGLRRNFNTVNSENSPNEKTKPLLQIEMFEPKDKLSERRTDKINRKNANSLRPWPSLSKKRQGTPSEDKEKVIRKKN